MIYDDAVNGYVLASGRFIYANRGILGLGPDDARLYEGYDGGDDVTDWTLEERHEIAEAMIARWSRWAAQ